MNGLLKGVLGVVALVAVIPRILVFYVASALLGRDRALEGATQSLANVPGLRGQYWRRAFLAAVGVRCHSTVTICYGTMMSKAGAAFEQNVYVGPGCHLGLVHLERDVLIAAGVHIPSGGKIHAIDRVDVPIREQGGTPTLVRIGAGTWVGSGSVILADVGRNTVIGAGSVVTSPIPDNVIAAGVPARVIRERAAR